ncbi:hypothetical protein BT96DRAFT_555253 [Gymnopus androsaceus JB14]|uniref:RTA1-domain-containing protein n=1 Tax=Gymnopus androsaceus JB14 TaxID=1447944 RepID=A0A6A4GLA7_9AGAR|nr:hypothetical protein BT96DRAFT_555253 [Gymnopus androsaceus JB14]
MQRNSSDFQENATCFLNDEVAFIKQFMSVYTLLPAAIELLLYGIFLVLFGLCVYIFRQKYMPGKLYVAAPFIFFAFATVSVVLDLMERVMWINIMMEPGPEPALAAVASRLHFIVECVSLVSSVLADGILVYRFYRLWSPRFKRFAIIPSIVGFLAVFGYGGAYAILQLRQSDGLDPATARASSGFYRVYILGTFIQNLFLTCLIGRVWYMNRKTKIQFNSSSQQSLSASQNLLSIFVESGILFPLFVLVSYILDFTVTVTGHGSFEQTQFVDANDSSLESTILGAGTFTQIIGIASTLLIVRIGLGVDVQTIHFSATEDDHDNINSIEAESCTPQQNESVRPFSLKYDRDLPPRGQNRSKRSR